MIERSLDVPFDDPVAFVTVIDVALSGADAVHWPASRSQAIGAVQKVAFPHRFWLILILSVPVCLDRSSSLWYIQIDAIG
jgi:hypothetical protein